MIGVLALQGDFEAHVAALEEAGARACEIRRTDQLEGLGGLVLPGGESTTLLRLIGEYGFDQALPRFVHRGGAVYGTCAGAILLAREVTSPSQPSLNLIDVTVQRNGYGRQGESFETALTDVDPDLLGASGAAVRTAEAQMSTDPAGPTGPLPAVFIRAPRILRVGPTGTILAAHRGEPVVVREGRILVSTFHPELTPDRRVHRYFLERVLDRACAPRGEILGRRA